MNTGKCNKYIQPTINSTGEGGLQFSIFEIARCRVQVYDVDNVGYLFSYLFNYFSTNRECENVDEFYNISRSPPPPIPVRFEIPICSSSF